jgi:hypothetical protein
MKRQTFTLILIRSFGATCLAVARPYVQGICGKSLKPRDGVINPGRTSHTILYQILREAFLEH